MILRAAWVLPISGPPIRDGAVKVIGDRITEVGTLDQVTPDEETIADVGRVILTPGLVNPHTHLELTCYAGRLEPAPFWSWIWQLVKLRAAPGQVQREQEGVREGAWQSLRAGVTCVGDISRRNLHWHVLKPIPIRKVCFVELLTLADDPPRNPAELETEAACVQEDPLLTVGLTPHAPYTVPLRQIQATIALATKRQRPWCTHWAETREECEFLRGHTDALDSFLRSLLAASGIRSPRMAPFAYLAKCVGGAPPGALAHCNYLEPGDAERLAAAGHVVMYCPRSHRFFGHEPHPYRTLLQAGVTVALGTDSAASNENLSLLEELRYLRRETPEPPPDQTLLRMVTLDAARALGLQQHIGSLEVGKQADLAAFPCPRDTADPAALLVETAPLPSGVWVAGRRLL